MFLYRWNTFTKLNRDNRIQKMSTLQWELIGQQAMLTKPIQDAETATEVTLEISRILAKNCQSFINGEFVKQCLHIAAKKCVRKMQSSLRKHS